jgi:hypothetical protein
MARNECYEAADYDNSSSVLSLNPSYLQTVSSAPRFQTTLNSSLNVRPHVSHPYETTGETININRTALIMKLAVNVESTQC